MNLSKSFQRPESPPHQWRFAVDRGGTYTDIIGVDPAGRFHIRKLLSVSEAYPDAAMAGIRQLVGSPKDQPLPAAEIESIRFGTTVATNALLEGQGGRVALLITDGFGDLLEIGNQSRPDIFSLAIQKPHRLYHTVIEVRERIDSSGAIETVLDRDVLKTALANLPPEIDAVAVVLMHAWINPVHEKLCEEVLREMGISRRFLSHQTMNRIKIVGRGQSTVLDASLSPILAQYMAGIQEQTGDISIAFMQSSGGLAAPSDFKGKNAILSGPAGGMIAIAHLAKQWGEAGVIGFDMGGTSTDVCRFSKELEYLQEKTIAGVDIQAEMLNIATVAAGGGSRLWFDGQRMRVGPESAGSYPGPTCYGFGGPLTITDANLLTGRIQPQYFPQTFGPQHNEPLNLTLVQEAFQALTRQVNEATGIAYTPESLALGFLSIANETMAMAIKEISVAKGIDVRDHALVCFGGAGGQHACQIAKLLDMERIRVHPTSGVMSAYGIGMAQPSRRASQTLLKAFLPETHAELIERFSGMVQELNTNAPSEKAAQAILNATLRPPGADHAISVPFQTYEAMLETFRTKHLQLFGFLPTTPEVEVAHLGVELTEANTFFPEFQEVSEASQKLTPLGTIAVYFEDGWHTAVPVYEREGLPINQPIIGPALVMDPYATLVIEPGFLASANSQGTILIERAAEKTMPIASSVETKPEPVLLEVFHNAFMSVAMEMGHTLQQTAFSVNIKERLDFSCALFDAQGNLIANAPHQPVHLGSMSDTVQAVLEDHQATMQPGDLYATNNPYRGGSHLPDMTVVCPVFSEESIPQLLFFTAARGHHADVGGTIPGSMPPTASHIEEEGVLLNNFLLVRGGALREEPLREILTAPPYPVRNLEENLSNFKAQMAACQKGALELTRLIDRYGWATVSRYMGFIQENAAFCVRQALSRFLEPQALFEGQQATFERQFEDSMDDGTPIRVRLAMTGGNQPPETLRLTIDFTGTGPQHTHDNLNAPLPVTRSAVLYVLKLITQLDFPLNSGCLRPVELIVPEGCLLNPRYPAPVASGNVETSQRVVDVLLGCFGIAAASQGTMNNLLFEVAGESPYYETIAGGSGAVDGFDGASGVQVHMTNTRITDPEILELRHPGVRLRQFSLRKGSGGQGQYRGGDGVVREIQFLKPATVTVLSERRQTSPFGLAGGGCGEPGKNHLRQRDGVLKPLPHRFVSQLGAGESILIQTPCGGGYGKRSELNPKISH